MTRDFERYPDLCKLMNDVEGALVYEAIRRRDR